MIITAITQQKRRPGRVSIFIDGTFAFGMEQTDSDGCGLSEGMTLTREQLDRLMNEVVFGRARDTALRYLSLRPRTLRETLKRLREDDYPSAIIKRVLILMVKYRYINDRQYAKDYFEERTRAHYGTFRIKQELKTRGVKTETIDAVISQNEFDETASILEFIRRSRKNVSEDVLRRRGFSYAVIKEAFQLIKEQDE